jgi:hypothetical protein
MFSRSKIKNKKFRPFNENDYLLLFIYLNACIYYICIHIFQEIRLILQLS